MTVESPLAEQQRTVVELYVDSKWVKASLALEDEHLFIEYANDKHDQSRSIEHLLDVSNNGSANQNIPDNINSQKRNVKIIKSDNAGLGKKKNLVYCILIFLHRNKYKRW